MRVVFLFALPCLLRYNCQESSFQSSQMRDSHLQKQDNVKAAVKNVVVVLMGAWLALFAGSTAAVAQLTGGSVSAMAGPVYPNPVASGLPATASLNAFVTTSPTPPPYCTLNSPTWSWVVAGSPAGEVSIQNPSSQTATLTATFASPGTYTVSATVTATWTDSCGDETSASASTGPISFTVVGVQNLQYLQPGSGYVTVSGTLYVLLGYSVIFQAVPNPNGSGFPSGQPVWSGSSGASGTGSTCSVSFNTLSTSTSDYQTVTATCGNTYATANVIVFNLTPTLTPQDNYAGRDLNTYGVCEYIKLNYQTTPSGITASEIGGLQWLLTSGGGTLTDNGDGTGTYQCPDVAATVDLTLAITGGPCLNAAVAAPARAIVPPDGVSMVQNPGTGLKHVQGFVTVGFQGLYSATCANAVSFAQIEVREGTCQSTATGYWAAWNNITHDPSAS
jgi:hypothetical protein